MATVAQFETAIDAAVTALTASDFVGAYLQVGIARVYAAALPRTTVDGATVDYKEQVKDLHEAVAAAELAANRSTRRMVGTRMSHSRRPGRGGRVCSGGDCGC